MNLKKLLDSEKSFIHITNSSGPKMEPCVVDPQLQFVMFRCCVVLFTNCSLFARYLLNKLYAAPRIRDTIVEKFV